MVKGYTLPDIILYIIHPFSALPWCYPVGLWTQCSERTVGIVWTDSTSSARRAVCTRSPPCTILGGCFVHRLWRISQDRIVAVGFCRGRGHGAVGVSHQFRTEKCQFYTEKCQCRTEKCQLQQHPAVAMSVCAYCAVLTGFHRRD